MKCELITECFVSNPIQGSTEIKVDADTILETKEMQTFKSGNFQKLFWKEAF